MLTGRQLATATTAAGFALGVGVGASAAPALRRLGVRVFRALSTRSAPGAGAAPALPVDESDDAFEKALEASSTVERISVAEEARTLMHLGRTGILSTLSKRLPGYPVGSVVGYATDAHGLPFFAFSSLSLHTQNLFTDARCSLTVLQPSFASMADARVCVVGDVRRAKEEERQQLRDDYLKKHPDAFWVDFGDFSWFRMASIQEVSLVGGFARAAAVPPAAYSAAHPDPLADFSDPVARHMNDDHAGELRGYVQLRYGVPVASARLLRVDRLGFDLDVTRGDAKARMRIGWEGGPVTTRKGVKDALVALAQRLPPALKEQAPPKASPNGHSH
eukprot:tig00020684_g12914.t1